MVTSAALLPFLLASSASLVIFAIPWFTFILAASVPVTVALTCLRGWSRVWGALLGLVVFVKFTILVMWLDFIFSTTTELH